MRINVDDIVYSQVSKVSVQGHVHIPAKLRKVLDLNVGDFFQWLIMKDGSIIIKKVKTNKIDRGVDE